MREWVMGGYSSYHRDPFARSAQADESTHMQERTAEKTSRAFAIDVAFRSRRRR